MPYVFLRCFLLVLSYLIPSLLFSLLSQFCIFFISRVVSELYKFKVFGDPALKFISALLNTNWVARAVPIGAESSILISMALRLPQHLGDDEICG